MENFYYRMFKNYLSASADMRKKGRDHWTAVHAENLRSGRDDMIHFSANMLNAINLADGELVKNCPKWIVNRVAQNMLVYHLDLNDAFEEALRKYPKPLNKKLLVAWNCCDFREFIPSAYLPEYLDFEQYPLYNHIYL